MSAKYKSPSFLLPNETNTSTNPSLSKDRASNYSMDFNGTGDYIDCGNDSVLQIFTGSHSVSAWIYFSSAPVGTDNVYCGYGLVSQMALTSSRTIRYYNLGLTTGTDMYSSTALNTNSWNHVVCTYEVNGNKNIYINGVAETPTSTSGSITSTSVGFMIGARNNVTPADRNYEGKIDEMAIFNRALNTTEIAALYEGTSPNIYPSNLMATNLNPIAYYPLGEQAQNSGYLSASGNEWQFPNGVLQDYVMDFDGSTGYINVGENILPSGNFTISAWVKPDSFPIPYATIFSSYENSASGRLLFRIKNDGKLELALDSATLVSNTSLSANTWQHVMITLNGTSLTFYLNGSSDGSATASTPPAQNLTTYIGAWDNGGSPNGFFNGEISNLAVWNTAITDSAQIANIYNNGSPQTTYTVTPQNWWKLNADSVYTPSAPNYTTALDFNNVPTAQGVIYAPTTLPSTSAWSVSFWAVRESSNQKKWLWSAGSSSNGAGIYNESGQLRFTGTAAGDISMGSTPFAVGDLFHMVASYDGSTLKVYIDGSEFYSGSVTTNIGNGYITIGGWNRHGYPTGAVNYYYSQADVMSNFAVWDLALTASQVLTLFNFGTPQTNISFSPRNYYKLDNTTTGLNDLGSSGANAFISGTGITQVNTSVAVVPSWKIPTALTIPTINYTSALKLESSNSESVGFSSSINTSSTTTFSMWLKPTSTNKQYLLSTNNGIQGILIKNNKLYIFDFNAVQGFPQSNDLATLGLADGNWHHLAITRDNRIVNFYFDGNNINHGTPSFTADFVSFNVSDFGKTYATNQGGYYDGEVSNLAIFNSVLSLANIQTLYNNGQPQDNISFTPTHWWKLNSINGTTVTDTNGSNNGTTSGSIETTDVKTSDLNIPVNGVSTTLPSTALQQSNLQFDSPFSNYSLSLDGAGGNYIDCGDSNIFSFTNGSGQDLPFSLSAWVNMADASSFRIITKYGTNTEWYLYTTGSDILRFRTYDSANSSYIGRGYSTAMTSYQNQWIHIVGTYDGSESNSGFKLYINATRIDDTDAGSGTYNGMVNSTETVKIGKMTNSDVTNGKIDETSIFNYALSSAQILEIYNNGKPSDLDNFSGTAPISWWRLGENAYFDNNNVTLPNSINGAPNGVSSGTATSMLTADSPGTYANGIGTNLDIVDRVGDAPLSIANSQSYNIIPSDISPYVPGYVGDQIANNFSMTFDGVDDYFDGGNDASLQITGNLTISMWFKTTATAGYLISDTPVYGGCYSILIGSNNQIWARRGNGVNAETNVKTSNSYNDGNWHHVAFVSDSTMRIYIDGVLDVQSTVNTPSNIGGFQVLKIGDGFTNFTGEIDEVAIFDTALNAGQIYNDIYQPTATGTNQTADLVNNPNLPTPVAWYRMGD